MFLRFNVFVLKNQLWVVVLESMKTALSVWSALPQTLAYLMANPQPELPSFGMMTNGDDIFVCKTDTEKTIGKMTFLGCLVYCILQVLKSISGMIWTEERGIRL